MIPWPLHDRRFGRLVRAAWYLTWLKATKEGSTVHESLDYFNTLMVRLAERARRKGRINLDMLRLQAARVLTQEEDRGSTGQQGGLGAAK